jgi:hypothetical protein
MLDFYAGTTPEHAQGFRFFGTPPQRRRGARWVAKWTDLTSIGSVTNSRVSLLVPEEFSGVGCGCGDR